MVGAYLGVSLFRTQNWESVLAPGLPATLSFSPLPGQVLSSLEGAPIRGRVPLRDLSVTLDVFVLTLPLEVELPPASDPQHHRYGSKFDCGGAGLVIWDLTGLGGPLKKCRAYGDQEDREDSKKGMMRPWEHSNS